MSVSILSDLDNRCDVTKLFMFMPWLPLNDGLHPGIMSQATPFLSIATFGQGILSEQQKWSQNDESEGENKQGILLRCSLKS
jgi:hypothetical protein